MTSLSDPVGPRSSTRLWTPAWPVPVGQVLGQQRHGGSDPTYKVDFQGRHWKGLRTPEGEATLMIESRLRDGAVYAAAWGEGAEWALDAVPGLLGAHDDPTGFDPRHQILADVWRQHRDWRIGPASTRATRSSPTCGASTVTGGSDAAAW